MRVKLQALILSLTESKGHCTSQPICFFFTGRAESIRLMLKDQGKEFKEVPVTFDMWMEGTVKNSCVSYLKIKRKLQHTCHMSHTALLVNAFMQSPLSVITLLPPKL